MTKVQCTLIRGEVAFWGLSVMSAVTSGGWSMLFGVLAIVTLALTWALESAANAAERGDTRGFWAKVWDR